MENKMEKEQEFSNAEYIEKIKQAELELGKTKVVAEKYLDNLEKTELVVRQRFENFGSKTDCETTLPISETNQIGKSNPKKIRKIVKAKRGGPKKSKLKVYKCDQCHYSSKLVGSLKKHKRTHSGEKPFKCDQCVFSCAQSGTLIYHKRRHTGEKPYKCDQCDYSCARSSSLLVHKRRHTGEKPYACDQCHFTCIASNHLIIHKRRHSGEKPYKCQHCEHASATKSDLNIHQKRKHKTTL